MSPFVYLIILEYTKAQMFVKDIFPHLDNNIDISLQYIVMGGRLALFFAKFPYKNMKGLVQNVYF